MNIALSNPERRFRIMTGFTILLFLCIFSLIPLFPIASLANLNAVRLQRTLNHLSLLTLSFSSPDQG